MNRLYGLGFAYLLAVSLLLGQQVMALLRPAAPPPPARHAGPELPPSSSREWFKRVKPRCNSVEAVVAIRTNPPPSDSDTAGYVSACYALAGKIRQATRTIQELPSGQRSRAAGIVFAVGHPVADAGDDESAGPIMELVIRYQPENYMALYHAGMSEYILDQHEDAAINLQRFLEIYRRDDGWTRNAKDVLQRLAAAP